MTSSNRHPRRFLPDGSLNPAWRPRPSGRKRTKLDPATGEPDPLYVPDRRRRTPTRRPPAERSFLPFDGEGMTIDGQHRYVYLATLGAWVRNMDGISTRDALNFLIGQGSAGHTINVCYGASYDVNMILRDLPRRSLSILWELGRCVWDNYEISYIPRKALTVKRFGTPRWKQKADGSWARNFEAEMTLYDVYGFFQSSFVVAIEKWLGADYPMLSFIREQKARRSQFAPAEIETITAYCAMELETLVDLMDALRESLREAEIVPQRWQGAGSVASVVFRKQQIKPHMQRPNTERLAAVNLAARHAYFGGRVELPRFGRTNGEVHHYDINSAYPAGMAHLPSLASGFWSRRVEPHMGDLADDGGQFSLWRVRWRLPGSEPFHPFPYRMPWGSIYFPPSGEGWYWWPEVRAAIDLLSRLENERLVHGTDRIDRRSRAGAAPRGVIEILEGWVFIPASDERPFAFVPDLYARRLAWKSAQNPAEKALKLAINSLYGKLAQHVGSVQGEPPTYHQIEWAGWITSYTRAALYRAAMQRPDAIISFQTDGLFSTEPLDLPINKQLGGWSYERCTGITAVQSGIYWSHHPPGSCAEHGAQCDTHAFYRGFDPPDPSDPQTLSEAMVLSAWARGRDHLAVRSTRFITLGTAVHKDATPGEFSRWRSWRTIDRRLELTPKGTKRAPVPGRWNPAHELVPTLPEANLFHTLSEPYPLPWEPRLEESIDGTREAEYEREWEDANL